MQLAPDGSARLPDGTALTWIADPVLGAVGQITWSNEPLDAAANDRFAVLFQVFLGAYRSKGAERPWLVVAAAQPRAVERRFNLLVHEFKWINFYGGGLAIIDPSPVVAEAFLDSAVSGYIGVFAPTAEATALELALYWFRDPVWTPPNPQVL